MIFKKIEVKNYEIQTKVFALLTFVLVFLWLCIPFLFFFNRYTYSNKHIDIKYLHSNLSNNTIRAIVPASSILNGDNFIIENYLAEYVKNREGIIPNDHAAKDDYIRGFTSPNILAAYLEPVSRFREHNPFFLRHIAVQRILKLDDTLYQVHYFTSDKTDYRKSEEVRTQMISTIRYEFAEIAEYDLRFKIKNFEILNPLRIEVVVYTTAKRLSQNNPSAEQ